MPFLNSSSRQAILPGRDRKQSQTEALPVLVESMEQAR
jgi:hypothetical protein